MSIIQDEINRLKANIRKIKKSEKALREARSVLVTAAKEAKEHLDNCEGGSAWNVLDDALESVGESNSKEPK